jgi:hypothetical protein
LRARSSGQSACDGAHWRARRRPSPAHYPIAIRFDQFTLAPLKALAELRNTGYQTLLKQFVVERLYEEERREGII